jgi:mono/diheme cytochrome c family protein
MRSSTRLLFAALVGLVGGCTGQIEEDVPDGITPEQEAARKAWVVGAQPVLSTNCASCHGGSMPAIAWLEGGDDVNAQKEDLLTYTSATTTTMPLVDFNAPQASLLIKKGGHDGPALTAGQASGVLDWIQKERDATPVANGFPIMTPSIALMPCTAGAPGTPTCPYNEFPLDAHGAPGAKVEFTAADLSGQLYLSNIKVVPGPMGAYVEHPVFVSVPAAGEPKLDPLDRYAAVKLNIAAGAAVAMQQLGTGSATFPMFNPADPLALYAKAVGPMKP